MNRCPRCNKLLVAHENVHAIDGKLYDSRTCFLRDYVDANTPDNFTIKQVNKVWEDAIEYYSNNAEVLASEEVLSEDLQEVQIAVTYYKTIKLPKCFSENKVLEVAEHLWNVGKVDASPDDYDDVHFECALVRDKNSTHTGGDDNA